MTATFTPRIKPLTREQARSRAIHLVGTGKYRLGGGADIDAETPFAKDGTCDCSGFTAWASGHSRLQKLSNGARIELNTDGIIRDVFRFKKYPDSIIGAGPQRMYTAVPKGEAPLVGDLVVYSGIFDLDDDPDRDRAGHVGIIVDVSPDFVRGGSAWWEDLSVVHCAASRPKNGAVKRTDAFAWRQRGYLVRPKFYTQG